MRDPTAPRTRRALATEEMLLGIGQYDYADAFDIRVPNPDGRSAEQWIRCGLEQAPWAQRWTIVVAHRSLLRFHLGPLSSPDHILGWKILASHPEVVHLEAQSPLIRGVIVGRRVDPTHTVLTTCIIYIRLRPARAVWAIVSPLHRRLAPYLLERSAATGQPRSSGSGRA